MNKKQIKSVLQNYRQSHGEGTAVEGEARELLIKLFKENDYYDPVSDDTKFVLGLNKIKQVAYFIYPDKQFSYNKLIEYYKPLSRKQNPHYIKEMIKAARCEIEEQIESFWINNNNQTKTRSTHHVDHKEIPFIKLLADWYSLQPEKEIKVCQIRDDSDKKYFKDRQKSLSWRQYHLEHAQLQILPALENIKNSSYGHKIDWTKLVSEKF